MEESNIRSQQGSPYDKIPQKGKYMHMQLLTPYA